VLTALPDPDDNLILAASARCSPTSRRPIGRTVRTRTDSGRAVCNAA
jgi:hypothetical protein